MHFSISSVGALIIRYVISFALRTRTICEVRVFLCYVPAMHHGPATTQVIFPKYYNLHAVTRTGSVVDSQLLATDIKIAMKIGKSCLVTLEINMPVTIPVSIMTPEQIRRMRYFRHLRNYFKIKKNASVFAETISHVG